ncbi:hypothetical protein ACFE04_022734 [Oxalis oulophora]
MDLATENRLAAMLMKEAAELRRQSEQDGVLAYLRQPAVRCRPNARFLTATVRGVQQANRVAEVNEMWQARQKELGTNHKKVNNGRSKDDSRSNETDRYTDDISSGGRRKHSEVEYNTSTSCYSTTGEGLRDEEVEKFLHSRVKRGRGAIGSRMDETGPYLLPSTSVSDGLSRNPDKRQHRVLGPEKPLSLKGSDSSDEEQQEKRRKKAKKSHSSSSDKKHSRKHIKKEKSKDKKRRRKEEKRRKEY